MSLWPRLRKRSSAKGGRGGVGVGSGGGSNKKSSSTSSSSSAASSTTKSNPYDTRGDTDDKYVTLHADFLAQRAQFAAEKGVPISVVRFVSRSARGWVFLPPDSPDSVLPSPSSRSRSRRHHRQKEQQHQQQQQQSHEAHDDEEEMTSSSSSSETSREFALPPPAVPLPRSRSRNRNSSSGEVTDSPGAKPSTSTSSSSTTTTAASASASSSLGGNVVVDSSDEPKGLGLGVGSTTNAATSTSSSSSSNNRLVVSRNLKDKAWMQISKSAAVLLVKVLVFSKAVGSSTGFACIIAVVVGTWNRGRSTFQRVVSGLATLLVSSLKPYLSLLEESKASLPPLLRPTSIATTVSSSSSSPSAAATSASPVLPFPVSKSSSSSSSAPATRLSYSSQMKVSPIMEGSEAPSVQESSRSSSFAFPVLAGESRPELEASARFPPQSSHQLEKRRAEDLSELHPETEATSPPVSSSLGGDPKNKLPEPAAHRRTCKLKSKLFKSSPTKTKSLENSLPTSTSAAEADGGPGSPTSSSGSSTGSNGSATGAGGAKRKKNRRTSFIRRKSSREGGLEFGELQQQQQPSTLKPPKKLSRSHELPFFRTANANRRRELSKDGGSDEGVKNLSRSQELKSALKSLAKKKMSRSQELAPSSSRGIQGGLALASSTVDSLNALAFPFKEEEERLKLQQQQEASSPRRLAFRQRRLAKTSSSESGDEASVTSTSSKTGAGVGVASPPSPKSTSAPPSTWASPSTTFSKLFPSSSGAHQPSSPKSKNSASSNWPSPSTTFSKLFPASSNSTSSALSAQQQQPPSPKSTTTSGTASSSLLKVLPAHPTAGVAVAAAATTDKQLRKLKTSCGFVHTGADPQTQQQLPTVSELRKVKTTVARSPPLPTQSGELGRSELLSREILGSLLLFAILGFLLLGRISAILGTASFCLLLSHLQRFFAKSYTFKKKEDRVLRKKSSDPNSRRHQGSSTTSSPHWQGNGANPLRKDGSGVSHEKSAAGRQTSEYRKRVLIEGLLDRGNRRGAPS